MVWILGILCIALLISLAIMVLHVVRANEEVLNAKHSEQTTREELEPLRRFEGIRDIENAEKKIIKNSLAVQKDISDKTRSIRDYAKKLDTLNKALTRSIEGYGDEYLVPSVNLLDELADEYSFDATGQALKEATKKRKRIAKEGKASKSLFKGSEAAETLLVKAFSLQSDAILSKAKTENFGILTKKIEDTYAVMNQYGESIGARITKQYLNAYLSELRWAVNTQLLKMKDREEQKRLRDLEREDKAAIREAQRAQKAAEKEEAIIAQAMEAAALKLESDMQALRDATDAERAAAERELEASRAENERLQQEMINAAAERERAMSMAQLTKRGHVYVISNTGSFGDGIYKVGMTRRLDPMDRVKELGDASVPFPFDVHAMINTEDAPSLESELHKALEENRINLVNRRKEFFKVPLKVIRDILDSKINDIHWTIRAEAAQYRESRVLQGLVHSEEQSSILTDTILDEPSSAEADLSI